MCQLLVAPPSWGRLCRAPVPGGASLGVGGSEALAAFSLPVVCPSRLFGHRSLPVSHLLLSSFCVSFQTWSLPSHCVHTATVCINPSSRGHLLPAAGAWPGVRAHALLFSHAHRAAPAAGLELLRALLRALLGCRQELLRVPHRGAASRTRSSFPGGGPGAGSSPSARQVSLLACLFLLSSCHCSAERVSWPHTSLRVAGRRCPSWG